MLEPIHQRAPSRPVLMYLVNQKNANHFPPNFLSEHLRPGALAEQREVWHLLTIKEFICTATESRRIPFSRIASSCVRLAAAP